MNLNMHGSRIVDNICRQFPRDIHRAICTLYPGNDATLSHFRDARDEPKKKLETRSEGPDEDDEISR